ncbi:MotA/TolQ/ExbB proton channel family protein [Pontibacter sp. G13]|uniref:MotA/TolQ/ExbB proton channel family protein n=1 Tax=Pontibacter sp. G13 TaxID=3074898 RepID=UPI00288B210B|nr:MotA/TolQ/ExbB proton channel family protein [Pontibacter sp. G13]WNJ17684.1 MotA/TolQ/ExbB proton channel family protein [Pontibacter sp. G13]
MFFLLQAEGVTPVVTNPEAEVATNQTIFEMLLGSWVFMLPLVILLGVAIFLWIERYLTIKGSDADAEEFMKQVRAYVLSGNIQGAKALCESRNDPFSRMIHKGVSRLGSASLKDIEGSIENVGKLEVYRMERRLSLLATIAGAAPMIGFFGTVVGMIVAFQEIVEKGGNANAVDLAGGISTAMLTTAGGLVVGILAYFAYNTLVAMVNKVVYKLELTSTEFIDLLQEPAS